MIRRTASLRYFWRHHIAVAAGAAIATAVLTGALLVGDSVRYSLRRQSLDRLGGIDLALVANGFFRHQLAAELASQPRFGDRYGASAAAILSAGSARHAATGARVSKVAVAGLDRGFLELFGADPGVPPWPALLAEAAQGPFPPVVLNASLREQLGAAVGDDVLLSLPRWSQVPRASLLGRRDSAHVLRTLRLRVAAVVPDRGLGRFALSPHQAVPLNAFVPLAVLQRALGRESAVNALFVTARGEAGGPEAEALDGLLRQALSLEDLGLGLRRGQGFVALESGDIILRPEVEAMVESLSDDLGLSRQPIITYLANTMTVGPRSLPYSTITALDSVPQLPGLRLADGSPAPSLAEDEILLDAWSGDDLAAEVGDEVEITYYAVDEGEQLVTRSARLRLAGIVELGGLASDRSLTPALPGIHDAEDMAAWDPPFPVDLSRIRARDEEYWDAYGAAPKAFVSEAAGRRLWRSRFGSLTSVRLALPSGAEPDDLVEELRRGLVARVPLEGFGLRFQAVKAKGLRTAEGATDFSGLFIGFSFFLIASSALLVALLFSLGVEQRSSEVGTLLALGFRSRRVRRRFLVEGVCLGAAGGLVGLLGAVGYSWLLMAGLRSWWQPAVGSRDLLLHVEPASLLFGYLGAVAVIAGSVWWSLRRMRRQSAVSLLSHRPGLPQPAPPGRRLWSLAFASLAAGAGTLAFALLTGRASSAPLFFAAGSLLLVAGLAFFTLWCRGAQRSSLLGSAAGARLRIAIGGSTRHPGRSVLSASLVACASFVLVTVAASHREIGEELRGRESGGGGYALIGETDIPVFHSLASREGRFELGFPDAEQERLSDVEVVPLRLRPGDDASCLNLYRPEIPRILGAPTAMIRRGGFSFQSAVAERSNPWQLLEEDLGPGVIATVGDFESAQWILHLGLGDELVVRDEAGEQIRLRLVALLKSSIFQSELLISEAQFLRHFPSREGYSFFLMDAPWEDAQPVGRLLEARLADYGFDATTTVQRMAAFKAVANTYLSTFQSVGGLGLLLGTLGLAVVLVRNVIERRRELATLRAFGYRHRTLTAMVAAEHAFLLAVGLALGTASALVAVFPNLLATGGRLPLGSLLATLGAVLLFGLAASGIAAWAALRAPLLETLKRE